MDLVSDLTGECFIAIGRLHGLEDSVASPEAVQAQLRALVDTCKERARKAALPEKDAQDIAYALVALIDEVALRAPEPRRGYWMNQPLQLHYFGENVAGEGFFTRLDSLLADRRRLPVLRVYQLCLLFGFQGKYGFPGGDVELMRIAETVRSQVQRSQEEPSALSPAGDAPDEPLLHGAGRNLLLWLSLGIFALALAVFVGLRLSFDQQVGDLAGRVDEIAP
ncbi:MAG: DotU family type IV/VI secretion system protein [Polyangia bacterium]